MHDAPRTVPALAREVQGAVFPRKWHTQLLQPGNGIGRVLHHEAGGGQIAQAGACDQGVVHMRAKAVPVGQHGGNAALGPGTGTIV